MTTINGTYVNALLADTSYVSGLKSGQTGVALTNAVTGRMTAPVAKYIADNFTVVTQRESPTGGFDATVWRGNAGTPYAGKIYVSMRGTQGATDISADVDLAVAGLPYKQLVEMVNWWLKETTPVSQMAKQIGLNSTGTIFVSASDVPGGGTLSGIGPIHSVNGHSLGGYLATAFVRLFGNQQPPIQVETFNSAGYSRPMTLNIENSFNEIPSNIVRDLIIADVFQIRPEGYAKSQATSMYRNWSQAA